MTSLYSWGKSPKYKLQGLMDDLLSGHFSGNDVRGLVEVLDELCVVGCSLAL